MAKNNISSTVNIIKYENTNDFVEDVCLIINSAQKYAHTSVNRVLVERNWLIGYRIAEEELKGKNRADYGKNIIIKLSKELVKKYGTKIKFSAGIKPIVTLDIGTSSERKILNDTTEFVKYLLG